MNKLRTFIKLDKHAFEHNIEQLKTIVGSSEIGVVIKSNAYGHGIKEISLLANKISDIEWICVSGLKEAIELKKLGITKKILALSYIDDNIRHGIKSNIHFPVYNLEKAIELSNIAYNTGQEVYVHIKIDTGMSRLGVLAENALEFIKTVKKLPFIKIYGLYTHLCDGYNINSEFAYVQLKKFDSVIDSLVKANIEIPYLHIFSSSGLLVNWKTKYNLVRLGTLIYGIWRSQEYKNLILAKYPDLNLLPVMTWKTHIIDIKHVPADSFIGYSRTAITTRPTTIGTLPIGYFDGYNVNLSNKAHVLVNGKLAPVIGRISMNLTTIDLTGIQNIKVGDEVTLLGEHPEITASKLAILANTMPNDIITKIDHNIPREVFNLETPCISLKATSVPENQLF